MAWLGPDDDRRLLLMGVVVRDWVALRGEKVLYRGFGDGGCGDSGVCSNDDNASRWGRGEHCAAELISSPDVVRVELRKKKRNVCGSLGEGARKSIGRRGRFFDFLFISFLVGLRLGRAIFERERSYYAVTRCCRYDLARAADRGRCGTGVVQDDYFERRLVGRLGYAGPPSLGNVWSQHGASIFRFSRKDGKDDDRVMGGGPPKGNLR